MCLPEFLWVLGIVSREVVKMYPEAAVSRYKRAITFMILFFFLGGLARAGELYFEIYWLRGAPELIAALIFFTPAVIAVPNILETEIWETRGRALVSALAVLVLLGITLLLVALGICAYVC